MAELFQVRLAADDTAMTPAQLAAAMGEADVLVPTVTDRIDAGLIGGAGQRLKLIAHFGNGVDNIDLHAAHEKQIAVTNTPNVLTQDTADMTMALILAVPRRLAEGARLLEAGHWRGWSPTALMGHRISGKRLGIIGMGRIGTALARRARGFGLSVHYFNRRPVHPDLEAELQATFWQSLDQMLGHVDILSIHCPRTPATFHLLSRHRLSLLPAHAYIVNTSRGEVIDEDALADLLEQGRIAGVGLDVFEHEPAVNPRLLNRDNTILLPHMGSATIESRQEMGEKVIINIKTFIDGHKPPDRVLEILY